MGYGLFNIWNEIKLNSFVKYTRRRFLLMTDILKPDLFFIYKKYVAYLFHI